MSFIRQNIDALERYAADAYDRAVNHPSLMRYEIPRSLNRPTVIGEALQYVEILVADTGINERDIDAVIDSTILGCVNLAFHKDSGINIAEWNDATDWLLAQRDVLAGRSGSGHRHDGHNHGRYSGASQSRYHDAPSARGAAGAPRIDSFGGDDPYVHAASSAGKYSTATQTTRVPESRREDVKKEDHYKPRADLYDFATIGVTPPAAVESKESVIKAVNYTLDYDINFASSATVASLYFNRDVKVSQQACIFANDEGLTVPCAGADNDDTRSIINDMASAVDIYEVSKVAKIIKASYNGERFISWFDGWITNYLDTMLEMRYGFTDLILTSLLEDHSGIYGWLDGKGIKDEVDELLMTQIKRLVELKAVEVIQETEGVETVRSNTNLLNLPDPILTLTLPWKSSWVKDKKSLWVDGCSDKELFGYLYQVACMTQPETFSFRIVDSAMNSYTVYKSINDGKIPSSYLIVRNSAF